MATRMSDKKYREFQDWFRSIEESLEAKYDNYWPIYSLLKEAWSRGALPAPKGEGE